MGTDHETGVKSYFGWFSTAYTYENTTHSPVNMLIGGQPKCVSYKESAHGKLRRRKSHQMTIEKTTERIIESFNRGIFLEPQEFTDHEIRAIAAIPGIDSNGTFSDAPMEQSLIRFHQLDVDRGENTWPAFAKVLHKEKFTYYAHFPPSMEDSALDQLNEAIAACLSLGIPQEQIVEEATCF